jgi:hypothetical protein
LLDKQGQLKLFYLQTIYFDFQQQTKSDKNIFGQMMHLFLNSNTNNALEAPRGSVGILSDEKNEKSERSALRSSARAFI